MSIVPTTVPTRMDVAAFHLHRDSGEDATFRIFHGHFGGWAGDVFEKQSGPLTTSYKKEFRSHVYKWPLEMG